MPKKKPSGNSQNNDPPMMEMGQMQCFWSSLSKKEKQEYHLIQIQDLIDYLIKKSSPRDTVITTFKEAIAFAMNQNQKNVSWEFWLCSGCNQAMFRDEESYVKHILETHVTQVSKLDVALPNDNWIDKVSNDTWKPVDVPAALKIIQDSPTDDLENQIWPLCDEDPQRAELLERIRKMFKQLVDDACFTMTNLEFVESIVNDELMDIMPETHQDVLPLKLKLHDCICFLDVSQLDLLLQFLNVLSEACKTVTFYDEDGSLERSLHTLMSRPIQEVITFNKNRSCLVLDRRLLAGEISPLNYLLPHVPPTDDLHDHEVDAFVKWIFSGSCVREATLLWTNLKTQKMLLEKEFILAFEKSSEYMLTLYIKSMQLLHDEINSQEILKILVAEREKRETDAVHEPESYESLLQKWLSNVDLTDSETSPSPEEVLIETVLKKAKALDVNDMKSETSASVREWLSDMKSTNEMHRQDASIKLSLQIKRDMNSGERNIIDSVILRMDTLEKTTVDKFKRASTLDYRAILLSFIQSYLKDRLIMQAAEKKAKALADELVADENKEKKKIARKQKQKEAKKNKKKIEDMLDFPQEEDTEEMPSSVEDIGDFDRQLKLEEEEMRKLKAEAELVRKGTEEYAQNQLKQLEELKRIHLAKKAKEASSGSSSQGEKETTYHQKK